MKHAQATEEAFSPQKRTSSTSKHKNSVRYFFLFLWVIFALLDPDPDPATQINTDPCGSESETLGTVPPTVPLNILSILTNCECHILEVLGRLNKIHRNPTKKMFFLKMKTKTNFLIRNTVH
jgi:hypothetical protein